MTRGCKNVNSKLGVANYDTSSRGTRYKITDEHSRYWGVVEVSAGYYNVRDRHNEPVSVNRPLYDQMVKAVKDFVAWQPK